MNRILILATVLASAPVGAQTADSTKYARCAGSSEPQKCRALVDSMASETSEAKRARAEKLEKDRLSAAQEVVKAPGTNSSTSQRAIESAPKVGMGEYDAANTMWGQPAERNRTVTARGSREQWVFGNGRFVYLENGRVTAVSIRH